MLTSNIHLILALLLALVSPTYGGLSWGLWLGADWADVEGELSKKSDLLPSPFANNPQFLHVPYHFK